MWVALKRTILLLFQALNRLQSDNSCEIALLPENRRKNYYPEVLPCELTPDFQLVRAKGLAFQLNWVKWCAKSNFLTPWSWKKSLSRPQAGKRTIEVCFIEFGVSQCLNGKGFILCVAAHRTQCSQTFPPSLVESWVRFKSHFSLLLCSLISPVFTFVYLLLPVSTPPPTHTHYCGT